MSKKISRKKTHNLKVTSFKLIYTKNYVRAEKIFSQLNLYRNYVLLCKYFLYSINLYIFHMYVYVHLW